MEALNALGMHPKQSEPADQREEDENRKSQEPVLRALRVLEVGCTFCRGGGTCGWEQGTQAELAPATKPSDGTNVAESHR